MKIRVQNIKDFQFSVEFFLKAGHVDTMTGLRLAFQFSVEFFKTLFNQKTKRKKNDFQFSVEFFVVYMRMVLEWGFPDFFNSLLSFSVVYVLLNRWQGFDFQFSVEFFLKSSLRLPVLSGAGALFQFSVEFFKNSDG